MKHIYNISQIERYLNAIKDNCNITIVKDNKKVSYYNIPVSFDIETSSFYDNGEKVAIMYEWTWAIYDYVIIGRTWEEFERLISVLVKSFSTSSSLRMVVYVHNLSYEFQFIRKHFTWEKVFAIKERETLYALTNKGIMFKCSYLLSGYSLAKVAENLQSHKIRKLKGDLDYSKIRTPLTPLSVREVMYCVNDVLIITYYIKDEIDSNKGINNIPLTQTGYVRRYVRNNTLTEKKGNRKYRTHYYTKIHGLTLTAKEYSLLKRAFMGGFTHANSWHVFKVHENVSSFDFTSSYPAVMLSERFPMSKGKLTNGDEIATQENLDRLLNYYCCVFDIEFYNIREKFIHEHYISESRCYLKSNALSENGRVYKADKIAMTITNIDFNIIKETYDYDYYKIGDFYYYHADYLPKEFLECILNLYESKNLLKGVKGKEVEYMKSKQMLNSTYGMSVTDIVKDVWGYENAWKVEKAETEKSIEKYNKSGKRFLFYPWGIFVTAYARRNLWKGIIACNKDYIYSDTDSIKILNKSKHDSFIVDYNQQIKEKLAKMCARRKIDFSKVSPRGKTIGVWDFEGTYDKFKTLGAKRYLLTKEGKTVLTVSGLNKFVAMPYMLKKWGDKVYENFTNNLKIPRDNTGKMTHTYIDDERKGFIVDYKNIRYQYSELSAVHLENAPFTMCMTSVYLDYLFKKVRSNVFTLDKGV